MPVRFNHPIAPMTAKEVVKALRQRHRNEGGLAHWAFFESLRVGTGFAGNGLGPTSRLEQVIDAYAFSTWPSEGFRRIAYEVKVSRGDFYRELKKPEKREAAMALSNRFYFATPRGLVSPSEVPDDCGLVVVSGSNTRVLKEARYRHVPERPMSFLAMLVRRLWMMEQETVKSEV